jgi:S-ribosylhomocysteine lyase LuxS involved in autoinducer biosynthesis
MDGSTGEISHGERADNTRRFLSHLSTHVLMLHLAVCVVVVDLSPLGCLYPSFYIQGGEVIRKIIKLVRT